MLKLLYIEYQSISYFADTILGIDDYQRTGESEIIATFNKLGIYLVGNERSRKVAVDAIFDSVSIATTYKAELESQGVVFSSFSYASRCFPEIVRKYLSSVVPLKDNFYATINTSVFTDGSFVFVAPSVKSPLELSTYFRVNASETGQFERTLILSCEASCVTYLEGCTAPAFDSNQLHAAVVELIASRYGVLKYSTVQNWFSGDRFGNGGIFNFVTKRGICKGQQSRISWTQAETGSAITWKYPSVVLQADNSFGDFQSVTITTRLQQADTGTKMIHIGKRSNSRIVSKGVASGLSLNCFRGLVKLNSSSYNSRIFSQCDSLLLGDCANASTYPSILVSVNSARVEHEASTSKIGNEQLFYFFHRGVCGERAVSSMLTGFCSSVIYALPLEFSSEMQEILSLKIVESIG